jgi:hypothetical protein
MERIKYIRQPTHDGILFLQGVFKKDCKRMEDMFREKLIAENPVHQEAKIYDKIPVIFTTVDKWLKSTNLHCWYCCRNFKNRPWFEPQSIEPISEVSTGKILNSEELKLSIDKKQVSIVTNGIFCTCNCVRAYIDLHNKDLAEKINKIAMLRYLYEVFNGKSIPDIQPSPPPTEMIHFGGVLSSTEYQQKIDNLDTAYQRELEDNNFVSICNIYIKTITSN